MHDDGELARLRDRMDAINARLAALLHERAQLVRAIGAWKRAHRRVAIDEAREAEMMAAVMHNRPEHGYSADDLRKIFTAVFAASRRLVTNSE